MNFNVNKYMVKLKENKKYFSYKNLLYFLKYSIIILSISNKFFFVITITKIAHTSGLFRTIFVQIVHYLNSSVFRIPMKRASVTLTRKKLNR